MTDPNKRTRFYLWISVAMTCTMFAGFWFTYFHPLFEGVYPPVSPIVHFHGWSFFLWYFLFTTQAALIRSGRTKTHQMLGLATIFLGVFMITVGLIVSVVRIDMSVGPDADPFWAFMGVPIFSVWVLFTVFYASALYWRRHQEAQAIHTAGQRCRAFGRHVQDRRQDIRV